MCQKSDWKRHRIFCRDAGESNVEEDQHAAEITEIDLDNEEGMSGPRTHKEWKADLLKRVQQRGVRRLAPVYCELDPRWSVQLLAAAAPLVEELEVWNARPEHWLMLASTPRLLRLEVNFLYPTMTELLSGKGQLLRALPRATPGRLVWLRVCLPKAQFLDLVKLHAVTLRELQIFVGTDGKPSPDPRDKELAFRWPWYCGASELSDLIQSCELKCLRRLVLRRPVRPVMSLSGEFTHHPNECLKQMEALRSALPDTKQVLCGTCDNVQWKCFQFTIFGMF